jgi:shikimate dehydrogenase
VPFKVVAWQLAANYSSKRALEAGAVNTLIFSGAKIIGDNTDGIGLVRDIQQNIGIRLKDKRILLVGAGGAAQGVLHPLLEAAQKSLVICNRSPEKAVSLKRTAEQHERFRLFSVDAVELGDLNDEQFDVVINATSAGLMGEMPGIPKTIFAPGALAYDLMYGHETPFMKFARANGATTVSDGLGMLVEQAAESFYIWRKEIKDLRPATAPVIAALRLS